MSSRFFFQARTPLPADAAETNDAPRAFHRKLPGYEATPLVDAPELARMFAVRQVLLKNEVRRFGLPAFKILGASWAIYRVLQERTNDSLGEWRTFDDFVQLLAPLRPLTLATATDGNHGRAVARMAKLLGFEALIFMPRGTVRARIDAIASEGARVEIVDGTYDDAVARAAGEASERCLVISDTSWPGYEEVPRWVMEGYSTIMSEIDDELARRGETTPDLVAVQFGVGALAAAVVRHFQNAKILSVEPLRAPCMLESIEAGKIVDVPGPHDSIMAGLNCGRVSIVAWPIVSRGIDAFIAIEDERAREAIRALARIGIVAGETGASGVAGLLELLTGKDSADYRRSLGIDENTRVLAFITEGATDPESYQNIVADHGRVEGRASAQPDAQKRVPPV